MSEFSEYMEMTSPIGGTVRVQRGEFFITDSSGTKNITVDRGGEPFEFSVPRYSVWSTAEKVKKPIAVGDDLKTLMRRFDVKKDRIFKI